MQCSKITSIWLLIFSNILQIQCLTLSWDRVDDVDVCEGAGPLGEEGTEFERRFLDKLEFAGDTDVASDIDLINLTPSVFALFK